MRDDELAPEGLGDDDRDTTQSGAVNSTVYGETDGLTSTGELLLQFLRHEHDDVQAMGSGGHTVHCPIG
ncbi:hypothetical protein [Nocardioides sp.]|uniref:hypothetical protein n=1 Tax=Nocardioides sp. TaxID=35761 RepID=UPI003D126E4B